MTFHFKDIFQGKITENGVTESMVTQGRSLTISFQSEFYRHKHFKYDVLTPWVKINIMLNPGHSGNFLLRSMVTQVILT